MIQLAVIPYYVHAIMVMGFLGLALLLILVILIQKPQGGGLSGAFGAGASSGQTAFGAKTGDMLTWLTVAIFCLFVLGAIGLNFSTRLDPTAASTTPPATLTGVDLGAAGDDATGAGAQTDDPSDLTDDQADDQTADPTNDPGGDPVGETQPPVTPENNETGEGGQTESAEGGTESEEGGGGDGG